MSLRRMFDKIRYVCSCALKMDYKDLWQTVNVASKDSGKSKIFIFFDILSCALFYGAGFSDYLLCEFYNLNRRQRKTYVTRAVNNRMVSLLNNRDYYHFFDNKKDFYRLFSAYMGRKWMDFSAATLESFAEFMQDKDEIMVKPDAESGGKGVEKISKSDFPSLNALYAYLKKQDIGVVEEVIHQHPDLSALNETALNTLRVVTILNEEGPHIVYAYIRIGNGYRPVDNLHAGGMCAPLDLETGQVQYPAYDKDRKIHYTHPRSGTSIEGFQIPFWKEIVRMCLDSAMVVPQMRYVGWDIGISENGPVFVEGNNLPGYDILQLPPHVPDKVGMLPRFRLFVKEL